MAILAMARPYLRGNVWWLKVAVPSSLRASAKGESLTLTIGDSSKLLSVGEVVVTSLHTRDPAEARTRAVEVRSQVEAFFAHLRAAPEPLTQKQRVAFAGEMRRLALAVSDDNPGDPKSWSDIRAVGDRLASGEVVATAWDAARGEAVALTREDAILGRYGAAVREVEARHGLRLTPDDRLAMAQVAHEAMQDAARINGQKAAGDYSETGETGRYPPLEPRKVAPQTSPKTTGKADDWSFGAVIDKEAKRRATGKDAKPLPDKTVGTLRRRCERFAAHRGSADVRTVTAMEGQAWVDALAEAGDLGGNSIKQHLETVRQVIAYAQKQSLGAVLPGGDPLRVVRPPEFRAKPGDLSAYRQDEARKVLLAARASDVAHRRWLPWLLAHCGARAEEGAALRSDDFFALGKDAEGRERWFFRIGGDRGEGVKTEASRRTVPVHPALVAEGFLAFVKAAGSGPLFIDDAAKQVARWVRSGAGVTRKDLSPNHGWRHLFEDFGRAAGIPEMALNRITGRTEAGSRAGYGGTDAMLPGLWDQMARIAVLRVDGEGED